MRVSMILGAVLALAVTAGSNPVKDRYLALADERQAQKNHLGAAFLYEKIVEADSTDVDVLFRLAHAYTEMGKTYAIYFDEAQDVYRRIERIVGPDDRRFREAQAAFYSAKWDMDAAISVLEGLLGEYPDDCGLWIKLGDAERFKGMVLREQLGVAAEEEQLLVAEKIYRETVARCPDRFESYHGLAVVQNMFRQFSKTSAMYAKLLEEHPGEVSLIRGKVNADFTARDWENAAVGLGELLERDPQDAERLKYISVLLKLGRTEEAEAQEKIYKETAARLHGPDPLLPVDVLREKLEIADATQRAVSLSDAKKYDEAVSVMQEARARVEPYLASENHEERGAAEELQSWIDLRITYFQKLKAQDAP